MSYLIDTNVLSELTKQKPNVHLVRWFNEVPNEAIYISVLTLGEIRKGIEQLGRSPKKEKLKRWLEHELIGWFDERMLAVDHAVAERWGRLQSEMKRTLPAIDSLIVATALHFDLALVTRNEKDFVYPGLEVINPFAGC